MPQFIGTSMKRGFAGLLTRGYYDNTTEILANDPTASVKAFGVPVKLNATANGVTPTTATGDTVYGFAVRKFGQVNGDGTEDQNLVTVLKRGYIAVTLASGTAKRGGKVYLNATGGITADAGTTPANTAIPGAEFMGAADSDNLVEIGYNI